VGTDQEENEEREGGGNISFPGVAEENVEMLISHS